MMNKWQTALTTNPAIANAVGMLLDIIGNCNYQMDGAPMNDGKKITALIKTGDDIVVPFQFHYAQKQK